MKRDFWGIDGEISSLILLLLLQSSFPPSGVALRHPAHCYALLHLCNHRNAGRETKKTLRTQQIANIVLNFCRFSETFFVQVFRNNFCSGFREHYPEPRHRLQPPRPLSNLSPGPSCLIQVNILIIFLFSSYSVKISSFTFISCEYLLKSDKIVPLSLL